MRVTPRPEPRTPVQPALGIDAPPTFAGLRGLMGGTEPEVSCDLLDELRLSVLAQPIDEALDVRCVSL